MPTLLKNKLSYNYLTNTFFSFPIIISIASIIKLIQHGENKKCISMWYDIITVKIINDKIQIDILRKYLYSLLFNGFSGVSSGQKISIGIAQIIATISNIKLKLYVNANLQNPMQDIMDNVDIISHFVSVEA